MNDEDIFEIDYEKLAVKYSMQLSYNNLLKEYVEVENEE